MISHAHPLYMGQIAEVFSLKNKIVNVTSHQTVPISLSLYSTTNSLFTERMANYSVETCVNLVDFFSCLVVVQN
jgi:hypothetical protein